MRKELQKKQTSSARKRLKEIGQRENRYMTDVNHCITKALVTKYPRGTLFVLEDLTGVRNATEKVRIRNRYVSVSWAFYQFRQMLEYKAELYGHKVIFCCKNCSYKSNDDRIGAMNLYRMGVTHLAI